MSTAKTETPKGNASQTAQAPAQTSEIPAFNPNLADGLSNVAARFPLYDGGDARVLKIGTKGYPIHGRLLGVMDLPSTQKDPKTGEAKPWTGIVVELLQACPVKEKEGDDAKSYMAPAGSRMIFTETAAFARFTVVASHPDKVFEVMIQPVVSKSKSTGNTLWIYPEVKVGRPINRNATHVVGIADLMPADEVVHNALPEHASA